MVESESICKGFVLSDCGIADVSIFRNDRLLSNLLLFWSADSLAPCSKTLLGDFVGVLVLFRDVSSLNQLVAFLGVDASFRVGCFLFCFLVATFLTLSGVQLVFFLTVLGLFSAAFYCLVSSKHNFLIFSCFFLYSPTILQATMRMRRSFCLITCGFLVVFFCYYC